MPRGVRLGNCASPRCRAIVWQGPPGNDYTTGWLSMRLQSLCGGTVAGRRSSIQRSSLVSHGTLLYRRGSQHVVLARLLSLPRTLFWRSSEKRVVRRGPWKLVVPARRMPLRGGRRHSGGQDLSEGIDLQRFARRHLGHRLYERAIRGSSRRGSGCRVPESEPGRSIVGERRCVARIVSMRRLSRRSQVG